MIAIGIDPGFTGGIAAIEGTSVLCVEYIPTQLVPHGSHRRRVYDVAGMRDQIASLARRGPCRAALEAVHAWPGEGVVSAFRFGEGLGILQALLIAHQIPYQLVPPQRWTRQFRHLGRTRQDVVVRCFPHVASSLLQRGSASGLVDALLLALWARDYFEQ